jgi:hypothetical protein
MAIRIENSLFLMVNGRSNSARLLKHLSAKRKPENAEKWQRKPAEPGKETGMSFE